MNFEKPKEVREAQLKNDLPALRRMGKKGGENAAFNRDLRKAKKQEELKKLALEQARSYTISPEGDVLPPDPNIIEALEEGSRG